VSKRGGVNLEGPHVRRNVQEVVLILRHVDVVGETIVDLLIVVFARRNNSIRNNADLKGRLFSNTFFWSRRNYSRGEEKMEMSSLTYEHESAEK
jgi:hypothetical protein